MVKTLRRAPRRDSQLIIQNPVSKQNATDGDKSHHENYAASSILIGDDDPASKMVSKEIPQHLVSLVSNAQKYLPVRARSAIKAGVNLHMEKLKLKMASAQKKLLKIKHNMKLLVSIMGTQEYSEMYSQVEELELMMVSLQEEFQVCETHLTECKQHNACCGF